MAMFLTDEDLKYSKYPKGPRYPWGKTGEMVISCVKHLTITSTARVLGISVGSCIALLKQHNIPYIRTKDFHKYDIEYVDTYRLNCDLQE